MDAWNLKLPDEQLEQLDMRAQYVESELRIVRSQTKQRKSVSEIARLLGCSRNKVIWMQHVLQLRTARGMRTKGLGKWPREHAEMHTLTETETFGRRG